MRQIKARYGGPCKGCGKHFKAGDTILYGGPRKTYHMSAAKVPDTPALTLNIGKVFTRRGAGRKTNECSVPNRPTNGKSNGNSERGIEMAIETNSADWWKVYEAIEKTKEEIRILEERNLAHKQAATRHEIEHLELRVTFLQLALQEY